MGRMLSVVLVFVVLGACGLERDGSQPVPRERSLATSLRASLQVADVQETGRRIRSEVSRVGGFVLDSGSLGGEDLHFELRIPTPRVPEFRASVASLGQVLRETERTEDVSDQRLDLGARLRNAQVQEQRLLRLLEEKTGSLADVIAVEKELASVRETIEKLDAQSNALANRVELTAVSLELSQHAPAWKTPLASLRSAGRTGLEAVAGLAVGLGMVIATLAPTLLLMAALALGLWRIVSATKRWRARSTSASR